MLHDIMPETEHHLNQGPTAGYIGFDPTADSLHIGSLVQILILMHFQRAGHQPIALVGGATGMIGDPSGKSDERNLLDAETLTANVNGIKAQLARFLDFSATSENPAKLVNNFDWMKDYTLIDFSRDIGKHLTVNYMMAKDSVKKRLGSESQVGMSFTEFTYQLLQGYDFLHLYQNHNCTLQMGGATSGETLPQEQNWCVERRLGRPMPLPARSLLKLTEPNLERPREEIFGWTRHELLLINFISIG